MLQNNYETRGKFLTFRSSCQENQFQSKMAEDTCINLNWWNWNFFLFFFCCSRQNLESSDDGSVGTLSVLDADWSVITKYRGVFDLMNINELSLSITATVGCPLICHTGADHLLTSNINPSVVTRTFIKLQNN